MTLLECMVALLIFAFVILCVSRLYYFANGNMTHEINIEQLQQQTQNARNQLERDVEQAVATTGQPPMTTSDNEYGDGIGYGVIIITSYQSGLYQVNYQFTAWQNGLLQLQRSNPISYGGTIVPPSAWKTLSWTTLLTGVTFTPSSTTPFTVTTLDVDGVTTLSHPTLTIATLTVQAQHAFEPGTPPDAIAELITTLNVRGNVVLQEGQQ